MVATAPAPRPVAARPSGPAPVIAPTPARAVLRPAAPIPEGRSSPRAARDLAGLTEGQLLAVMGEPDLKRAEGGAEAWLYRGTACLLDVFLETDRPEAEPRVVLAAARPLGAAGLVEEACLRSLARARAGLRPPFQP